MGSSLGVAEIFRRFGDAYERRYGRLQSHPRRIVHDLVSCRTPELGGHVYVCGQCGVITSRFNSCRNRHCPQCQHVERERWLEQRRGEILPVPYFHLVFTVPHELNPLFLTAPKTLYNLLFRCSADALLELALDPRHLGARIGFQAILHTWGQRLELHPHLHMIVPGGGLSPDGERWVASRPDFFLPVHPLSRLLRGKLLDEIDQAVNRGERLLPHRLDPDDSPSAYLAFRDDLYAKEWNVHSRPPFGGAEGGLEYLGRYSHRVAISNSRLLGLDGDRVVFRFKDYRDDGKVKTTSLEAVEFLRRFLLHALPVGFQRLRSYGLLANRNRTANLETCRLLLGCAPSPSAPSDDDVAKVEDDEDLWADEVDRLTGEDPRRCPVCGKGTLVLLEAVPSRDELNLRSARAPP